MEMLQGSAWLQVHEEARVPLLGIVNGDDPAELEAEVAALLADGFATLKVKVGFDADADGRRVKRIQNAVAGRCRLRIDANQGYGRERGLRLRRQHSTRRHRALRAALRRRRLGCRAGGRPRIDRADDAGRIDLRSRRHRARGEARGGALRQAQADEDGQPRALARGIRRIREFGMEPVLGNGVACDIGCWMEACVARTLIDNAGEMNGFLRQRDHASARQPSALSRRARCCSDARLLTDRRRDRRDRVVSDAASRASRRRQPIDRAAT